MGSRSFSEGVECPSCRTFVESNESIFSFVSELETRPIDSEDLRSIEPGDSIGRFRIECEIGQGGYGRVYKAFDTHLERFVALKIPRWSELSGRAEAFFREAKAAAKLRDSNIVSVYEIGHDADQIFIVSDYIEGVTLNKWHQREKPDQLVSAQLVSQLACSIHKAHESGIVHRDLKPSNVIVDDHGVPYITDFGLAKNEDVEDILTSGKVAGTPAYMSPEQARGDALSVDCTTDIYSLGVILYELLTGVRPFQGNRDTLIKQVKDGGKLRPRQLDQNIQQELEDICLRAMNPDAKRRFGSALELSSQLDDFVSQMKQTRLNSPIKNLPVLQQIKGVFIAVVCVGIVIGLGVLQDAATPPTRVPASKSVIVKKPTFTFLNVLSPDGDSITNELTSITLLWYPTYIVYGIVQPLEFGVYGPSTDAKPYEFVLEPGEYTIQVKHPEFGAFEVRRTVPSSQGHTPLSGIRARFWTRIANGRVILPAIQFADCDLNQNGNVQLGDGQQLVQIERGEFFAGYDPSVRKLLGLLPRPLKETTISQFHIGQNEVTVGQFMQVMEYAPKKMELRFDGKIPLDLPVANVSYYEALEYCERVGGRLPTFDEYVFVATNGGKTKYPWGDEERFLNSGWLHEPVGVPTYDQSQHLNPVNGLFSSLVEWTGDTFVPDSRDYDPESLYSKPGPDAFSRATLFVALFDCKVTVGGDSNVRSGRFDKANAAGSPRNLLTHFKSQDPGDGQGFRVAK